MYDRLIFDLQEVISILQSNPDADPGDLLIDSKDEVDRFNAAVKNMYTDYKTLQYAGEEVWSVEDFHALQQENWKMPQKYKNLDIAKWCLEQCNTQEEIQRVGQELFLFNDRNMLPLLQYMKYMVDTLRENNIIWGVGRGSSVASYILFLIGVHKIDSLYYELNIDEFLR